jgi:hypothetical protein
MDGRKAHKMYDEHDSDHWVSGLPRMFQLGLPLTFSFVQTTVLFILKVVLFLYLR